MKVTILEAVGGDVLQMLIYAIQNKYEVKFWYKGDEVRNNKEAGLSGEGYKTQEGWREGQPVAIGKSKASGRMLLRMWQTKGTTNTFRPRWKTFLLDEITGSQVYVYDGADGFYYRPFDAPSGPDYNDGFNGEGGDEKMMNDQPLYAIDLKAPPGPNKGLKAKKDPIIKQKEKIKLPDAEPVFKKQKVDRRPEKLKSNQPSTEDPTKSDINKPIEKPDQEDKIQNNIIPTKGGNQKKPSNKKINEPEVPPPTEPDEEKPLNESWLGWLSKICNNG